MIQYREEQIRTILVCLENLEVKGSENCKRILLMKQTLEHPVKEETNDHSQE